MNQSLAHLKMMSHTLGFRMSLDGDDTIFASGRRKHLGAHLPASLHRESTAAKRILRDASTWPERVTHVQRPSGVYGETSRQCRNEMEAPARNVPRPSTADNHEIRSERRWTPP